MKVIVTQKARRDLIYLFEYNLENSVKYARRIDQNIRLHFIRREYDLYSIHS